MNERNDRSMPHPDDDARVHDDDGLHPTGEGLSETPIHGAFEAIAQRSDLARQLEDVVASARSWARAEGTTEASGIADALAEIYERLGEPSEAEAT